MWFSLIALKNRDTVDNNPTPEIRILYERGFSFKVNLKQMHFSFCHKIAILNSDLELTAYTRPFG